MPSRPVQPAEEFNFAPVENARRVVFIANDELPVAEDFAYVVGLSGERLLFIKVSRLTPTLPEQAWAAVETGTEDELDWAVLREHQLIEVGIRVGRSVGAQR